MEKLRLIKSNKSKIYEFKITRPLSEEEKQAVQIFNELKKAGFESYFAGGAVRDELMGIPASDIDIATKALPEEIKKLFPKSFDRGKQFGVMALVEGDHAKHEFEIATFRSDIGIFDHRHPKDVKFTTAEEDAKRRDFTINALFYDPEKEQIIDYVGGVEDLEKKILRFVGRAEDRINEDYLRMLRAVRFSARFDFEIEKQEREAIKKNAANIQKVSAERIRDELTKMLVDKNRVRAIELMDELGLLELTLPELSKLKNVAQPPEFHSEGDVWTHTLLALEKLPDNCSDKVAWAVLLHDIAKPETQGFREHPKSKITFFEHDVESAEKAKEILKRFKFPNEFIEVVSWSISQHMRIIHAFRDMSERKKEKLFLNPNIETLLEQTRVDLLASEKPDGSTDLSMYEEAVKLKEHLEKMPPKEKEQVKKFDLISGKDIMEILKIPSGPKVGEIKRKIEEAYLEGKISDRDEALEMIKDLK